LELVDSTGYLYLTNNWFRPNSYINSVAGVQGAVVNTGILSSATPGTPCILSVTSHNIAGFVDFDGQDFRLTAGSVCINGATALNSSVLPEHDIRFQVRLVRILKCNIYLVLGTLSRSA
jgi:hypothetical protein